MYVGSDLEQSYLQFDEHRTYKVSSYAYLDCPVDDKGLADDAKRLDITKAKKRLVMHRPVLRSKVLAVKTRAKLLETWNRTGQMSVKVLAEKLPLKVTEAWAILHKIDDTITKPSFNSQLPKL
ncbi:hypothetical protein ACTXT7_003013 [Hymenolepis weldensis]